MGYELHVKRLRDGHVEEIDETEWLDFVDASPDFVLQDELSFSTSSGDQVAMRGPFGCWTGHPSVDLVPLRWSGGQVTVPFGDEHAVVGALLVADALDAKVVGNEGEEYDAALGPLNDSPQWKFAGSDEPRSEPVATEAPSFVHLHARRRLPTTSTAAKRSGTGCSLGCDASDDAERGVAVPRLQALVLTRTGPRVPLRMSS